MSDQGQFIQKRRVHKAKPKKNFDKYDLYMQAVQSPEIDVLFFKKVYLELKKKEARILREDFCGTFSLCTEWVKLNPNHIAYGLDLDPEPLEYGRLHYLNKLSDSQKKRVHVVELDVVKSNVTATDIVAAMNFSYFLFKSREQLKKYFSNVLRTLRPNGIFMVDVFGGSACFEENEEKTSYKKFNYYWHQRSFDPVTGEAKFSIHFKLKGHSKVEDVFTYDWRLWTIPEIREVMHEVGFKKTHIYWEGTNSKGGGDGVFTRTEKGEECQAWVAYVVGEK